MQKLIRKQNLISIFIMHSVLISSCNQSELSIEEETQNNSSTKIENTFDKENEVNGIERSRFIPDTSIGKISLDNPKNVEEYLGANVMDRLLDTLHLPHASILSHHKSQILTFYFHYGNTKNNFSEFNVKYLRQDNNTKFSVKDKEFVTESNIKLGISEADLVAIKGEPMKKTPGDTLILSYWLDDSSTSAFLRRYSMPIYYADYKFTKDKLIEFQFGFEYP